MVGGLVQACTPSMNQIPCLDLQGVPLLHGLSPDSNKSNCMSTLTRTLPLGLHSPQELFIGSSRACLCTPTGVGEWNVLHVGEGAARVGYLCSQCVDFVIKSLPELIKARPQLL